ncbi:MAG: V-type ATP synthase subunit D [Prevotellaceae bacterium]|nr:V-type ATP synthase subunit D [Prevotellaceae bacterium]
MIKFQFNKTSLNELNKQLKMRTRALPTIKSKESALRMEVRRAKDAADDLEKKLQEQISQYGYMRTLWGEFDEELLAVRDVSMGRQKIAGVVIPTLGEVEFDEKEFSLFDKPYWYTDGVDILKKLAMYGVEREFFLQKMRLLDVARKKTTQKVNLYEKVQIPGYEQAILKIKRFMEDEENLSKAGQKIVKQRQAEEEEAW